MNLYYLTLILKPDLEEKEQKELLDQVKKKMLGEDGKIEKEDMWGVREFAYPIKRQKKGYYTHFEFQSDPKVIKGLDKNLKLEEDILRYLLVRR